jgi:hypothetical protein
MNISGVLQTYTATCTLKNTEFCVEYRTVKTRVVVAGATEDIRRRRRPLDATQPSLLSI